MANSPSSSGTSRTLLALTLFVGACICGGVLARFAGLGKWPFAIDEYYFAQSVQNVLHFGIPKYACGGFYTRGLLLQYSSALLQLAGLSPELAPRVIAAVSSLVALPAVFIIGRRVEGKTIGLIAVSIMALSVWEVEIARLGRMYAPFQALFLWYLVFFFSYTLDRRRRALAPMLALSVVGVLVWEGGVFLALANLMPPFIRNPSGRLQRRDWLYLAGTALLVVPVYWLATADLRTLGGEPPLPANYQAVDIASLSPLDAAVMPWSTLRLHPLWLLTASLPIAASLFAAYRIVRLRIQPSATLGLLGALACALLQQFELAAAIVLILLLLSILEWRELSSRAALAFPAAITASAVFWIAFGLGTHDWVTQPLSPLRTDLLLGYQFVKFPDFMREIAIPWMRTDPVLGSAIFMLVAAACVRAITRPETTAPAVRVLIALLVCLLLAASASHPPRHETRYVFFLYPLAIIVSVTMVAHGTRAFFGTSRYAELAVIFLCLGGFALTEDFQPVHLWNIDSAAVNFRVGLNDWQIGHYHPRSDVRGAAQWLNGNVIQRRDLVVSSFPGLDFYYTREDFFFMEPSDPRFESWACRAGSLERWGNRPLINSLSGLASQVSADRTVWLVIEPRRAAALVTRLAEIAPAVIMQTVWTAPGRDIAVIALRSSQRIG
jgi:Dolichyl-phosphate-mannose-protein mannosyltransferase